MVCLEDVRDFIYKWNLSNPVDRWWRERHKVPFNSPIHRITSFIDQFIEFEEKRIYDKFFEERIKKEEDDQSVEEKYIPGCGILVKKATITERESEDQFKNLNLDDFKF